MTTATPTKGPVYWTDGYTGRDGERTWSLVSENGYGILSCDGLANSPQSMGEQGEANANLIEDAFNTYTTTGLTPSELVKHINDLMEVIRDLVEGAETVERESGVLVRGVTNGKAALTKSAGGVKEANR